MAKISPATHHIGPEGVGVLLIRLKVPEGVDKPSLQQLSEPIPLLLSESSILLVRLRVLQVDLLVCNVHVTTDDHWFLCI